MTMSLCSIEFVSSESVSVKCEDIKEDEASFKDDNNSTGAVTSNTRCGEIFTSNNYDFTLICAFCNDSYANIADFGIHLRTQHTIRDDDERSFDYWDNESKISIHSFDGAGAADDGAVTVIDNDFSEPEPDQCFEEKEYHCKICNKQFRLPRALKCHVCQPETLELVETLIEDTLEIEPVVEPKSSKQTSGKFACEACSRQYQSERTLRRHKRYQCKASSTFKSKSHISQGSTDNIAESQSQSITDNDDDLLEKIDDPDANTDPPKEAKSSDDKIPNPDLFCDICNRQFKYKNIFKKHGMQHAVAPSALQNDPDYLKCCYCGLKLTTNAEWYKHENTHTELAPFLCTYCPKRFKTRLEVEMHTNSHTGNRPFKCDQCGASFAHSNNLSTHIKRVHLRLTPFSCDVCDKKFLRNVELRIHMRQHTGEKPYQCEECGRSFMIAVQLNEHLKRHTNIRDVKCPECPMAFFTKKMLRKHMVKHSTERPHVCSTCGRTFSRKKALIVHIKIHQDVKEYVCTICGKAFAQPAGLYSHKKSHMHSTDA